MSKAKDPLPSLQYFERYRNGGTRTYSSHASYTEAAQRYRPDSDYEDFDLPVFQVPKDEVHVFRSNPEEELQNRYVKDEWVRFCIHPQMIDSLPDDLYLQHALQHARSRSTIPVVPSSSTRTLYVQDALRDHALKVHFPFKVSRYTRKMREEVIEQAINVSRELEANVDKLDDDFGFLREVIGITFRNLEPELPRGENWGYIIRDLSPFPEKDGEIALVPGFALYGVDYFDPQTPPHLFELIDDHDPVEFVLKEIMLPVIRHWVRAFLQFGYLLEPHAQNVILALGQDHSIRRIIHRDLSVGIDMRRRAELGLPENSLNQYNRIDPMVFHSITYDRFMGTHFFDRLVQVCQERSPGVSKAAFTGPCREEFARLFPEHRDYMPATIWYFSEQRDEFNKPLFEDTGLAPEWRP